MSIGIISQILENILYKNTNGQGSTLPCLRETEEERILAVAGNREKKAPKTGAFPSKIPKTQRKVK